VDEAGFVAWADCRLLSLDKRAEHDSVRSYAVQWSDVEQWQPALAAIGHQRLIDPGVLLVGTIRRDGTPRLSPVEPFIMDGRLLLSMLWSSMKARDLGRDARILVHSIVTKPDGGEGEFKIRGVAREESDPDTQQRYASAVSASLGWHPQPGRFHLFVVDIDVVVFIRYDNATGDQYLAAWPPPREFVRRGTTATSLSGPEPRRELIIRD
jgi:hypothetical protein